MFSFIFCIINFTFKTHQRLFTNNSYSIIFSLKRILQKSNSKALSNNISPCRDMQKFGVILVFHPLYGLCRNVVPSMLITKGLKIK